MGETTRITLELERGSEPDSGPARLTRGPERNFSGYMELIAALDAVRLAEDGGRDGDVSPQEEPRR